MNPSERWTGRLRSAALFVLGVSVTMGSWLLRNAIAGNMVRGESLNFHPPLAAHYRWALSSISWWFLPENSPLILKSAVLAIAVGFIAVSLLILVRRQAVSFSLLRIVTVFFGCYLGVYLLNFTFLATDPLDPRASAPLFVPFLILSVNLIHGLGREFANPVILRTAKPAEGSASRFFGLRPQNDSLKES
jgi:hypothetical protein